MSCAPESQPRCFKPEKVERLRGRLPLWNRFDAHSARLKAAAHPGRLAVLHLLLLSECCVCDVADVLEIPVSTASQYLRRLRQAELLTSRQDGKWVIYSVADRDAVEHLLGELAPATRTSGTDEESQGAEATARRASA